MTAPFREASIDCRAITANVAHLRACVETPHVMAVVKANGYGHGAFEAANAALAGGADWLGVADIDEALALRNAGVDAPVLAWLHEPGADFSQAVAASIDVGVSSIDQLGALARAAQGSPARVQIKLETGLSRNGVGESEWSRVFSEAAALRDQGAIRITGLFSHLSNASRDADNQAVAVFKRGVERAASFGVSPDLVHVAATAAALRIPDARFTMVRLGIGIYGLSPFSDATARDLGLTPAMTLRGRVAAVQRVRSGAGVSYGYDYRVTKDTTLALVPLGYADGVPRLASNCGRVRIGDNTYSVSGRVAMDQFMVDVGDNAVEVGDEVVLFGDPLAGNPSADEWALAASTINYEIVTRIGPRVRRTYRAHEHLDPNNSHQP